MEAFGCVNGFEHTENMNNREREEFNEIRRW